MTTAINGIIATSACNGVTTTFGVPFQFLNAPDLFVYLHDAALFDPETATLMVQGTDYIIAGDGSAGNASVVPAVVQPAGKWITRIRQTDRRQQVVVTPNIGLPARVQERAFDRASLIAEELDVGLFDVRTRALQVPRGETIGDVPARAVRKGKLLGFHATTGEPSMTVVTDAIDAAIAEVQADLNGEVTAAQTARAGAETAQAGALASKNAADADAAATEADRIAAAQSAVDAAGAAHAEVQAGFAGVVAGLGTLSSDIIETQQMLVDALAFN